LAWDGTVTRTGGFLDALSIGCMVRTSREDFATYHPQKSQTQSHLDALA
jgi:hypothetical protein